MLEPQPVRDPRRFLLEAFAAALAAVEPRAATARALAESPAGPHRVIAAGKAAEGMLRAVLGSDDQQLTAAVVAAAEAVPADLVRDPRIAWHRGGHPLPDEGSLAAGAAVAAFVADSPRDARFLVLLSGGASALLELPRPGITLAALRAATAAGLGGGLAIEALNRERAAWSRLKAGGLAASLAGRPTEVLFMSDVVGDDPRVVGSGPCWDGRIPHRAVATNSTARAAAVGFAAARGFAAWDHGVLNGEAGERGGALARELAGAAPGLHVWGGECTVRLPVDHGRGGRCQQLALAAALAGLAPEVVLLACGSDGRDGPGRAAGALVDRGTIGRLGDAGVDAVQALARCDAGSALAASGDLVDTGATGTNVADLVIAWRGAARA